MRYIEIEQIGSQIRRRWDQWKALVGLNSTRSAEYLGHPTPQPQGDDPLGEPPRPASARSGKKAHSGAAAPNEAADIQLSRDLISYANGVVLEPYDASVLDRETPDFKLI
jgi:hypothetical protein